MSDVPPEVVAEFEAALDAYIERWKAKLIFVDPAGRRVYPFRDLASRRNSDQPAGERDEPD